MAMLMIAEATCSHTGAIKRALHADREDVCGMIGYRERIHTTVNSVGRRVGPGSDVSARNHASRTLLVATLHREHEYKSERRVAERGTDGLWCIEIDCLG